VQGALKLLKPEELLPHEDVDPARVTHLADEIRAAGAFYPPVLVDDVTRVILDGHHRWRASAALGLSVLPCYCVDYLNDPVIRVMSRRPEIAVTKAGVVATALAGRVYPEKTTRHMYDLPEFLEPVPLDQLTDA
jgi:ParB-like chromosome segregation protein Spo0J